MRTIKQIVVDNGVVFALCEDGSFWRRTGGPHPLEMEWEREVLPRFPEPYEQFMARLEKHMAQPASVDSTDAECPGA